MMLYAARRPPSIIPRQCSAVTTKGKQCRKWAVLGTAKCKVHTRPSPKDSPGMHPLAKGALEAFFEALKYTIPQLMDVLHALRRNGFLSNEQLRYLKRRGPVTLEYLGEWYARLDPATRATIMARVRSAAKKHEKYFAAGDSAEGEANG